MNNFTDKITDLMISLAIGVLFFIVGILTGKMGEFAFVGLIVIVAFLEVRKATKQMKKRFGGELYEEEAEDEPDFTQEEEEVVKIDEAEEVIEPSIEKTEEVREEVKAQAKLVREEENPDAFRMKPDDWKVYITKVDQLDNITEQSFENFCGKLLVKNGYSIVKERQNGIDLLATNLLRKYAVMCKQSNEPLKEDVILKLEEGKMHYEGYIGVLMTNGRIDSDAIRLGNSKGLLLWDRAVINTMMEKTKEKIEL